MNGSELEFIFQIRGLNPLGVVFVTGIESKKCSRNPVQTQSLSDFPVVLTIILLYQLCLCQRKVSYVF